MKLDTVGEFVTHGMPFECRIVRAVFDPVGRGYFVGHCCTSSIDYAFENWTGVSWGRPLTAKRAHRRVLSCDTHLRCLEDKITCAKAIEAHAKERGLW